MQQKTFLEKISIYIGIWKFSKNTDLAQLQEIAHEWAKDNRYLSIHIRNCSKEQLGIGFEYKPDEATQKVLERYCEETSDYLKRKTGNGLVGWDFSGYYYKIK